MGLSTPDPLCQTPMCRVMDDLLGMIRRLGSPVRGMLVLAVALAPSATRAMEPPPQGPEVPEPAVDLNATEAVVAALHREGEQRYANDDYAGAREAWLDAYERVPVSPETDPYRVTLLSLVTNATLADYAVTGAREPLQQTQELLVGALESEPDPALRTLVEQQLDRLRPLLRAEPSPEPEPEPAPEPSPSGPVMPEPSPPVDELPPALHPASTPLIVVGSVTLAGGLAMLGAGSAFGPRAQRQVPEGDDSQAGQEFIADERRKGYAWMGAGAGTAVIGIAMVVSGAVLRARSRRPRAQATVLLPRGGGVGLTLLRRF